MASVPRSSLRRGRWLILGVALPGLALGMPACGGSSAPSPATPAGPAGRPSFVVIVADDMARDLFGAGHRFPFLELPNLDRLAARGVQFDRAFVTTSLCSPSRASMLTGLYAHSHGVLTNESGDLRPGLDTYARLLQAAGYKTAFVGKWHMDSSTDAPRPGFDYWVSFRGQGVYEDPVLNENGRSVKRTGYVTDILTDYAVQWLRARGSEPFLLVLCHKASHDPFLPAPRHVGAFPDAALPPPANFEDSFLAKPSWQRRYVMCGGTAAGLARCPDPPPSELPPWPWPAHDSRRLDYLRTLLALDDSVGSVVSTLEAQGLAASTSVVFIGDNGMFLGEHRLGDKRLMYEESIRVPLVIAGSGVPAPRRATAMVLNVDLAPTILQLAGLAAPASMQGRSLVGLLRGQATGVRDSFLYEYYSDPLIPGVPAMLGVRTERWAYVTYPGLPDGEELYDLDRDPGELTSLASVPERGPVKAQLRDELARLLASTGGVAPPGEPSSALRRGGS
jgi:N-acetylglucosamine-6-sulfatase